MRADLAVMYVAAEDKKKVSPLYDSQYTILAALSRVQGQVLLISPKPSNLQCKGDATRSLYQCQETFLRAAVPDVIYQYMESFNAIEFPKTDDDSLYLKNRSLFVACKIKSDVSNPYSIGHGATNSSRDSFSKLSTASFSFNNGFNLATLTNVCLDSNKKEFIMIKRKKLDRILSLELRKILKMSSSGFYPFDAAGGWIFTELSEEEFWARNTNKSTLSLVSGVAAISSPPFAPQMVHTLQTLFPLVQAAMHPEHYQWINNLDRYCIFRVSLVHN